MSIDISSVLIGVFSALSGVWATVLATRKIEEIKAKFEGDKILDGLYIEVADLAEQCVLDINLMHNNYCIVSKLKKGIYKEEQILEMIFPAPPIAILLDNVAEKAFHLLSKDQRKGIRSLISLLEAAQADLKYISHNTRASAFADADEARFRLFLSTLCAIYHLSLNFSEQKTRFIEITKSPEETFESVLQSQNLGISFKNIMEHKINA